MFDISIIIFVAALIAIVAMFVTQYRRLKESGGLNQDLPIRDFSYENFLILSKKMQRFSLAVTHGTAIIITKLWVRVVHYISRFFRNSLKKIEARLMKLEKKNEGNPGGQSVFLTTIKTYKHEVKKLQGRVEEELPRPREEVANLENSDNIDESKPE